MTQTTEVAPPPIPTQRACTEESIRSIVEAFVAAYNSGAIEKVDALLVPSGTGFRFLSTEKWGVEYGRTRVLPILQEFYQAGERIQAVRLGEAFGAVDIGSTAIRYGVNGAIKFQIQCSSQLVAAIAWDVADQPALRR